jgi:hypothetical protein
MLDAREDALDEHGFCVAVVVEDHAPVTHAHAETLAAREPSHVERAILSEETIDRPSLTRLEIRGLA